MNELKLPKLHSDFSVDCVIFGFNEGELQVLLIDRNEPPFENYKAIPGNLANDKEDIDEAAKRVLYELTGLQNVFMEQYHTFGKVDRHPQGRVITVAYYALIKSKTNGLQPVTSFAKQAYWCALNDLPNLAFDHNEIVEKALDVLRRRIRYVPIGFELLPKEFSLSQLQQIYETILEIEIDKRNFRKKIFAFGFLKPLNKKQSNVSHRAAELYSFDKKRYKELLKSGIIFEP